MIKHTLLTTNQIFDLLAAGKPVSLIRVGDGEAMVLNGHKDRNAFGRVLKRQMGVSPTYEDAFKIRQNLVDALGGCDIIGVPVGKKQSEPDSYWFRAQSILQENVPTLDKKFCNIDIHYHLYDADLYKKLFQHFDRIFYISCREVNLKQFVPKVERYAIAPEMRFTTYNGIPHYPDQFNRISRWMDSNDIEGALCLVGAGVIGKIYCNWFRDRGGVAMDIGSIFDQWAGYVTRGPERERDKRDLSIVL